MRRQATFLWTSAPGEASQRLLGAMTALNEAKASSPTRALAEPENEHLLPSLGAVSLEEMMLGGG